MKGRARKTTQIFFSLNYVNLKRVIPIHPIQYRKNCEHKQSPQSIPFCRSSFFLLVTKISLIKMKRQRKYIDPFFRRHLRTLDCIKYNTMYILHHLEKCLFLQRTKTFVDILSVIDKFIARISVNIRSQKKVCQLEKKQNSIFKAAKEQ